MFDDFCHLYLLQYGQQLKNNHVHCDELVKFLEKQKLHEESEDREQGKRHVKSQFVSWNIKTQACDQCVCVYKTIKMTGKNMLFHLEVEQENRQYRVGYFPISSTLYGEMLSCVVGVIKEDDICCRDGVVLFPSFVCFECKMDVFNCRYLYKGKWCARTCLMIKSHV